MFAITKELELKKLSRRIFSSKKENKEIHDFFFIFKFNHINKTKQKKKKKTKKKQELLILKRESVSERWKGKFH